MAEIFMNLTGEWVKLCEDDLINNNNPYAWIKGYDLADYRFVQILYKSESYYIPTSCIQIKGKP
jgi:hypothetical protein